MQATAPPLTYRLTRDSADFLQSLPNSELRDFLRPLPKPKQKEILRQLATMPEAPSEKPKPDLYTKASRMANLEKYYPHKLSHRQEVFLGLDDYEAFYGGAAGGGKSDALLAAALEFIHIRGYSAIIFRRTSPNLLDMVERTREWWTGKAHFDGKHLIWTFPEGGKIRLGHMQYDKDKFNFKGPGYQFVVWDELSEFQESQYTYMFSRVRGPEDPRNPLSTVPCRVRATSNPDGEFRDWVKARFISDEACDDITSGEYGDVYVKELADPQTGEITKIPFVPARAEQNPGINAEKYFAQSLARVDPLTRDRLKRGDWTIREDGKIPGSQLRRYIMRGEHLIPIEEGGGESRDTIDCRQCQRFATIDTAGTSKEEAEAKKGREPSYSVVAIWDYWRKSDLLFLRHVWREQAGWIDLKARAISTLNEWGRPRSYIENAKNGPELASELKGAKLQTELIPTVLPNMDSYRGAKLERAITSGLFDRLEQGKLYIPRDPGPPWLRAYVNELTGWTGLPDEPFDQGDVTSHAAYKCKHTTGGHWAPIKTQGMRRS